MDKSSVTTGPEPGATPPASEENGAFSEADRAAAKQEYLQDLQKRESEENRRRMGMDAAGWLEEGRMLEQLYPGFRLENECRDPRFLRLLEVGMSMRGAFEALHHKEILEQAVRYTAQNISEKLVGSLQGRRERPTENGLSGRSGAIVRPDVRRMSRKDREEIERRALHGERISF